ncbi:ATP-binding cassette domain-containing protein [Chelativorans alearense]|uniref:ATP-binding cassette domain-containing protein n=1 Tax=Chelativorans alearense TaxID=2681495 RepID=UPI0013D4DC27|nr:sugar ABC transporter ATP-binding protein [Chelativorans alearense]
MSDWEERDPDAGRRNENCTASANESNRPQTLVSVRGLQKQFGATVVLKGVDFAVQPGQIHALLGGNGAGKSTMIRIITGDLTYDGGTVEFGSKRGDRPVVAVVHQELAVLPHLTLAENIGIVHARSFIEPYSARRAENIASKALSLIDPHLAATSLSRMGGDLTLHEAQIVEIARALSTGAEVLLLDEPTANLTVAETERLFAVLQRLAQETGIGIVFVSHRMKEIRQLCDVCTIIRDGRTVVNARPIADLTDAEIVRHMGQPAHRNSNSEAARTRSDHVEVTLVGPGIELPVHLGTILGLAGSPDGPSGLISTLIGKAGTSQWSLKGEGWPSRPTAPIASVRNGIGYVTGDRAHKGVLAQLPIIDNVLASRRIREKRRYISRSERAECGDLVRTLGVKVDSIWSVPSTLSGGNQQKLLIARWLGMPLRMVVLEEPTRGVDIGTKREIYALIRKMADSGTIIVWWSTENVELLEICDEILAFDTDGRCTGPLAHETYNEDALADLTGMAA